MDAEKRLNEFRRDRERREALDKLKQYISTPLTLLRKRMISTDDALPKLETTVDCDDESCEVDSVDDVSMENEVDENDTNLMGLRGLTKYVFYFALWAIPYVLLIKVGFGAVYFCVTALLLIYFNTRTRPKLKNEPSAYSVFNQDCASIDGTVTSEQLEKQLRSGILG